jgi:ABC-type nickel/cobalt efflux system permease component RcnA
MKDTTQWILAAIIFLLVILVGAYALSHGQNHQASNASVTNQSSDTPTIVASPSSEPTLTPSAIPSPSATPTPSETSGVKHSSYGYDYTYPEFVSYSINANPDYVPPAPRVFPSPSPSPDPTVTPSPDPTVTPTPDPTVTPTPSPSPHPRGHGGHHNSWHHNSWHHSHDDGDHHNHSGYDQS